MLYFSTGLICLIPKMLNFKAASRVAENGKV